MNEDLSDASSSYFFIFLHDLVIKNGTNGLLHLSFLLLEYLLLIVVEDHYDCNNRLLTIPFSAIFNGSRCNAIYLAYCLVSCAPLYCGQIGTLIDRIGVPEYAPGW